MKFIKFCKVLLILILVPLVQGETFVINPSKNAIWHNEKGLYFLRFDNYYGAIEEFKLAIALNHETQASSVFYNNLGLAYQKLGYLSAAEGCFKKAVSLNPYFIEFYYNLAEVYKQQGALNKFINAQKQAIAKNPYNSKAYLTLGLIYKKQNNKAEAIRNLSEFRRLEPDLDITEKIDAILKELRN